MKMMPPSLSIVVRCARNLCAYCADGSVYGSEDGKSHVPFNTYLGLESRFLIYSFATQQLPESNTRNR